MGRGRRLLGRGIRTAAGRAGYRVLPSDDPHLLPPDLPRFYSPVPDPADMAEGHFEAAHPTPGVELNVEAAFAYLEGELAPYLAEFPADEMGYRIGNGAYEAVDSELLYAMVRTHRPATVIEIGAGHSTLVIDQAGHDNDPRPDHQVFDPYPHPVLPERIRARLREVRAQDIPDATFAGLAPGDILFVDSTHVVRTGSDVNRLILHVLPRLAPGVLIHFHDIFLPYEYHRAWVENGPFWSEQYLLQALLAMNPAFEVLVPTHALLRNDPDRLRRIVPSLADHQPSSFWLTRTT